MPNGACQSTLDSSLQGCTYSRDTKSVTVTVPPNYTIHKDIKRSSNSAYSLT